MQHEPCRFLCDAKITRKLVTGDAIFAVRNEPDRNEPLVERNRRFLKDGSNLDGVLLAALAVRALPASLFGQPVIALASAHRANWLAIRPAHCANCVNAGLLISEISNGVGKCLEVFHVPTLPLMSWLVKYIYAFVSY